MQVRQVLMTPELASKLLESNTRNRLLSPSRVAALAAAMREGRFYPEAAGPIVIGADGKIQNGQHRLQATVESGHSWECILIEGAPENARMAHDTGKKRSFADWLRQNEITQETMVASVTRLLWYWDHGYMATRPEWVRVRSKGADHEQLWDFFLENKGRIMASQAIGRAAGPALARSVACLGAIILADLDEEGCKDFYRQIGGVGALSSQVTKLLKALGGLPGAGAGSRSYRGDQQHQLALLFKAWNFWQDGIEMEDRNVLVWKMGGKSAESMPIPHGPDGTEARPACYVNPAA